MSSSSDDASTISVGNRSQKPNNNRSELPSQRLHSNEVSVTPPVSGDEKGSTRSGFSLADRLSSIATEQSIRFSVTSRPKSISSGAHIDTTVSEPSFDDSTDAVANTGTLSLAERLALRNKSKQTSKPIQQLQGRRQPSTTDNRFTETFADRSTVSSRRSQNGLRNRFVTNTTPLDIISSTENDSVRRIPVRDIDDLPRVNLNFPKRFSTERVAFRTTPKPTSPISTEEPQTTTLSSGSVILLEEPSTTTQRKLPEIESTVTENINSDSSTTPTVRVSSTTEKLTPQTCPELQCLDGKCIGINQLNNGVRDCSDGSDEQDFGEIIT
ncbi:location of vulva defective 1-like [Hyalella azteca]|uniref:Location of vulva defective 1-like n=1 Tax=Hyalella azteca TaxID=294128 RepID=A0A8B7NLU6_HYAAZ|nr:location of vulva defective 1-like [Hyalella azteca]